MPVVLPLINLRLEAYNSKICGMATNGTRPRKPCIRNRAERMDVAETLEIRDGSACRTMDEALVHELI